VIEVLNGATGLNIGEICQITLAAYADGIIIIKEPEKFVI